MTETKGLRMKKPAHPGRFVRTVIIATIVNLGIVSVLLFDPKLARFLGSTRLVGWWAPRR